MAIPPTGEVKPPAEPVIQAAGLLTPGLALDLACGAGRHAIWLHQNGWKVTALDHNADAIRQLQHSHPAIDARVVDLEQTPAAVEPQAYELVVCWLYHQCALYPRIRDAVRPGGIAALSTLLQGRFASRPGELASWFPNWTILHHAASDRITELVVRRPLFSL